ncbi:uncharacterized protein [Dermacentor andersoni]|uniref:uncharacterized protein n=1 Tax=Dermacentor andersoni TaxID=34620 RepID=UPI002417C01E|nr:uncharacterized protein LOC126540230 [Dermacentor andersoni]
MDPWKYDKRPGRRAESHTSLSENTEQILSSWGIHMYRRYHGEGANISGAPATGEERMTTNKAVRFATAASTEQLLRSSSEVLCEENEDYSSETSERNHSLPYALIALISGLLMASAGIVLLRMRPAPDFSQQPNGNYAGVKSAGHHVITGRMAPASQTPRRTPVMATGGAFQNKSAPSLDKIAATESSSDLEERHLCDVVLYTYCPKPRREFVFDPLSRTCMPTAKHSIELCNQSPNRFDTRAECNAACVETERPSGKCFDRPVFAKCQRHEMKYSPWIFDGYACRPWHFPAGKCPSHNGHIFAGQSDCSAQCINGTNTCLTPGAQACPFKEFRFPYFAVPTDAGSRRLRCSRASAFVLRMHRCPTGTNRFRTAESCKMACSGGRDEDQQ